MYDEDHSTAAALVLKLIDGPPLAAQQWRLSNPFRIGRAAGNELELPDPGVSRHHASIEHEQTGWRVRDCGARRGIQLNGLTLEDSASAALRAGDTLSVGAWRFLVDPLPGDSTYPGISESATRISVVRGMGNLAEQRLELLLRYAGEIAAATNEATLAEIMAEHALLGSGYARATVLWRHGEEIVISCQRPTPSAENTWHYNAALVASAASGEIARLESDLPVTLNLPRVRRGPQRALCAPLMLDGRAEAFLYLDAERAGSRRHTDAPTFCHALARLGALALANLHRLDSERERAAFAADLEQARDVQGRLLPAAEGSICSLRYALRLHPGRVVAGDVVDVFELGGGRVVAALGDVSGAGLGASLVMASVQSFLRAGFAHDADPARVVTQLNAHLCAQSGGGRFVTLWLGVFEPGASRCQFVDAGHGHALRIGGGAVIGLPSRGCIPLGIDPHARFVAESLSLGSGETLLLYSDGIIEQRGDNAEPWGSEGLARALVTAATPAAAIALAWQALAEHASGALPEDDATLLALGGC